MMIITINVENNAHVYMTSFVHCVIWEHNKNKAFQLNADCPLANSEGYTSLNMLGGIQVEQVWTWSGEPCMVGGGSHVICDWLITVMFTFILKNVLDWRWIFVFQVYTLNLSAAVNSWTMVFLLLVMEVKKDKIIGL